VSGSPHVMLMAFLQRVTNGVGGSRPQFIPRGEEVNRVQFPLCMPVAADSRLVSKALQMAGW
jgi:hypothetical protein